MNPLNVNPSNIWEYRQNKPIHVAEDMRNLYGIPKDETLKILMARGICKWLSVRRQVIKLKNIWRDEITNIITQIRRIKQSLQKERTNTQLHNELWFLRGYLKALEMCRAEIRSLCHSERWQIPDFDEKAAKLLDASTPERN